MAAETTRKIYLGTELKFELDIRSLGFSMTENDFSVRVVTGIKRSLTIDKTDMILTEDEKYIFTVDTEKLGVGDYFLYVTAYVPDDDFDDGLRTEVQKLPLCTVTS